MPKRNAAAAVAEERYYELGLVRHWEAVEKEHGFITSRQIDKGLRWDKWWDSYRGLEFSVIRKFVKRLKKSRRMAAANN